MRVKNYVLSLFIVVGILFLVNPITVFADSPITSTDFYRAYIDVNIVKEAKEKGSVDQEIANYLHSSTNSIDVKAAVINALGWNFNGKSNAKAYVSLIYSKDINKLDMDSLSGDELFCISYMMALDNYFDVNKAESLMEKAYEKNKTSFTVAIIRSIIKGQATMSSNWGTIWTNTESVLKDKTLVKEMRQGAVDIIVEYMQLYENHSTNVTDTAITTNRLWGSNRYDTSVKTCEEGWKQSDYVVIASGEAFPDSLSAAPLAKKYNAPILLNTKGSLLPQVSSEIDRLQAKHAILIGGFASLSSEVENAIKTKGLDTIRLSGATRYETSIEIAKKIGTSNGVIVTTGEDYGDALSIAPIAGKLQMPIILAQKDVLNSVQKQFIANNTIPKTYVLGYTDIISDNVASKFPNVKRIGGENKYVRNLKIIDTFSKEIDFSKSILTSGKDFPDALSGSALAALNNSPIFLIGSSSHNDYGENSDNSSIATLLGNNSVNTLYTLGGNSGISDSILKDIANKIEVVKTIKSKVKTDSNMKFRIYDDLYSNNGNNYYRLALYEERSGMDLYNFYQYNFLVDSRTWDTYKIDRSTNEITPLGNIEIPDNNNQSIMKQHAIEFVADHMDYKDTKKVIAYEEDVNADGSNYYCIHAYVSSYDHISTVGWYYVEVNTGRIYKYDVVKDTKVPMN